MDKSRREYVRNPKSHKCYDWAIFKAVEFSFQSGPLFLFMYWIQSILFTTGLKGNQTTIKGRMILGWSFYAIGRLRPPIASCQSFPSSLSSLPSRWMDLHLSMILLWEDSPIPATGNSFTQSDRFTWVHIRREHFLTSMILFRMASKPITWLLKKLLEVLPLIVLRFFHQSWCASPLNCGAVSLLSRWQQQWQFK